MKENSSGRPPARSVIVFWAAIFIVHTLLSVTPAVADTYTVDPSIGQTIQSVLDIVSDDDEVLLKDGIYIGEGNRGLTIPPDVTRLTIQGESHAGNCFIDASSQNHILYSQGVDLTIRNITFKNGNSSLGGAIQCQGGVLVVEHSEFIRNRAASSGGALCLLNTQQVELTNCLFFENEANQGGAVYLSFAQAVEIAHCTFNRNSAPASGAIHSERSEPVILRYSILWDDSATEVYSTDSLFDVSLSDIDQAIPGINIRKNPLFAPAFYGEHYLAHADAGYPVDSPCVDAFSNLDAEDFPIILDRTTSPYHFTDTDELDLGYHYFPLGGFQTPTPTYTPTPTGTPTMTPTPTPEYRISLALSETDFYPGDRFQLQVRVSNWLKRDNPLRLIVVLDVFGDYFFYPSWAPDFDFQYVSLPVGESGVWILDFDWPNGAGSVTGLMFHAAFMDTAGEAVIHGEGDPSGGIASVEFGFTE